MPNESEDTLNQQLQQLIAEAKEHPKRSIQQRLALNRLIKAIQESGKLSKQSNWLTIPNYQDFYNEALQQTLLEICENLHSYKPEYPVMAWVNQIFGWRFSDLYKKSQKRGVTNIPKNQELPKIIPLTDFDQETLDQQSLSSEEQQLREIIEKDSNKFLSKQIISSHPHLNLKILLLKILAGKTWQEISTELDISLSTVSSFYHRSLRKVLPDIQKYL